MAALAVPKLFQPTAGAESCMYRGRVHLGACEFLCGTLHTHLMGVFETLLSAYTCQLVLTQAWMGA